MEFLSSRKLGIAVIAAFFALAVPFGLNVSDHGRDGTSRDNAVISVEADEACAQAGGCGCIVAPSLCCCCGTCTGSSECNFGCDDCNPE